MCTHLNRNKYSPYQLYKKIYPFETFMPKRETDLPVDSRIKSNQIRIVDKKRLIKLIGNVSEEKLKEVK